MENFIEIYTDGSSIGNGSPDSRCGWACKLLYKGFELKKSGFEVGKTNNYMEMLAVLKGLRSVTAKERPCVIYSDSQYVVKTMNKEFKIGANENLWEEIFEEMKLFNDLKIQWVKAHGKNKNNNEVDELAYNAALKGE
jgi:ribonuclease HI